MHPVLIAGIALVGLPVLLHLIMKQEPKRVLFPAFRFLKQKRNLNQRKMRLRHFLLLALRMLLIALFAATLFQPAIQSEGGAWWSAEQPVAVVVMIDTTPSMGYVANGKTRLEEVKRRAMELLDDLPSGSRVAVLDPTDPVGTWEQSVSDARSKIEAMTAPAGGGPAITAGLPVAYRLLRGVEQETDSKEQLPKLIAVFSDRAASSWAADRVEDLKKQRDAFAPQKVGHLYFDVGVDQPANVAITGVEISPHQSVPAGVPVRVAVMVAATGPDVEASVRCEPPDGKPQTKAVRVAGGSAKAVVFELRDLPKGVNQMRFVLEADDNLPADNQRFVTVKVADARKILVIADDPADAEYWRLAHEVMQEFDCDVKKPGNVDSMAGYESVTLLGVADPAPVWPKLLQYVEGGGKLLVVPGRAPGVNYRPESNEFAANLMPAKFGPVIDTAAFDPPADPTDPDRRNGVAWDLDDTALRHPLLAKFREWLNQGNVDVVSLPPKARKYFEVSPVADGAVVVRYNDDNDPAKRRPAVVEKVVGKGKVVLLTTRLEVPDPTNPWNDYWSNTEHSFATVFPHQVMTYLCGGAADANFQFPAGRDLRVPVPRSKGTEPAKKLRLEGPGVSGRDAEIDLADNQTAVRLAADRTLTPGNYIVSTDKGDAKDGFSLNPPAEESNLAKVPVEAVEDLFGPKSVVPLGKDAEMRDVLDTSLTHPVDLFPWLLILVLLLLSAEGVIANRFYRPVR